MSRILNEFNASFRLQAIDQNLNVLTGRGAFPGDLRHRQRVSAVDDFEHSMFGQTEIGNSCAWLHAPGLEMSRDSIELR